MAGEADDGSWAAQVLCTAAGANCKQAGWCRLVTGDRAVRALAVSVPFCGCRVSPWAHAVEAGEGD